MVESEIIAHVVVLCISVYPQVISIILKRRGEWGFVNLEFVTVNDIRQSLMKENSNDPLK